MLNLSHIFTLQSVLSDWSLSIDRYSRIRAVWKGKDASLIKERKLDYFTWCRLGGVPFQSVEFNARQDWRERNGWGELEGSVPASSPVSLSAGSFFSRLIRSISSLARLSWGSSRSLYFVQFFRSSASIFFKFTLVCLTSNLVFGLLSYSLRGMSKRGPWERGCLTGPKNDNTIDPLLSDFQTIRQHCDQAGRRHYSLPWRLQVLHHIQTSQPSLHPRGFHKSHDRQLHSITWVSTSTALVEV